MAQVINIRTVPFDSDSDSEEVTVGQCSACGAALISQWRHGFPAICPKPLCNARLENGYDKRIELNALVYPANLTSDGRNDRRSA